MRLGDIMKFFNKGGGISNVRAQSFFCLSLLNEKETCTLTRPSTLMTSCKGKAVAGLGRLWGDREGSHGGTGMSSRRTESCWWAESRCQGILISVACHWREKGKPEWLEEERGLGVEADSWLD